MLQELMEEVVGPHKLMLTWLLVHMNHIVEQVSSFVIAASLGAGGGGGY